MVTSNGCSPDGTSGITMFILQQANESGSQTGEGNDGRFNRDATRWTRGSNADADCYCRFMSNSLLQGRAMCVGTAVANVRMVGVMIVTCYRYKLVAGVVNRQKVYRIGGVWFELLPES
jgi:hypothetical protein